MFLFFLSLVMYGVYLHVGWLCCGLFVCAVFCIAMFSLHLLTLSLSLWFLFHFHFFVSLSLLFFCFTFTFVSLSSSMESLLTLFPYHCLLCPICIIPPFLHRVLFRFLSICINLHMHSRFINTPKSLHLSNPSTNPSSANHTYYNLTDISFSFYSIVT